MALWKYKLSDGWHTLYGEVLTKVMRKDKNLSDLEDIAVARQNLELVGNVTTHNHDTRYQPQINTLTEQINLLQQTVIGLQNRCTTLENTIASLQNTGSQNTSEISSLKTKLNSIPSIYVQTSQPSSASNKSIWIDMTNNAECIKVLWSSAWKNIGAFWK